MTMKSHLFSHLALLAAGFGACAPGLAHAQLMSYGDVSGGGGMDTGSSASDEDAGSEDDGAAAMPLAKHGGRVKVTPYIEAGLGVLAELSPGSDVLTYSTIAAGVDVAVDGRNTQGALSARYERRFGWGKNSSDSDSVSGIARVSTAIVPRTLTIEAGALASRMSVENNGSTVSGLEFGDSVSQVYSLYAGPSLSTRVGDVAVSANYLIGYNRVESPNSLSLAPGQPLVDVFDDSVVHSAQVHAGTHAGELLPVGIGVGAGWNREDVSNLDQRVDDKHLRADISIPIGNDVALLGGVGWEKVEISSRDAVRDPVTGLGVIGADGRYVTDKSGPRVLAYDSEGLIWDAGVMWRPSRRTALEAHVGKRYGSTSYYGSFAYAPSARTSVNVSVYDNVTGFGGMLNKALANLPTQFEAVRNPLNGDLGGCVAAQGNVSSGQSNCYAGALGSVRSSVFRGRGVMASINVSGDRLQYGAGAGYDRRKFMAAPGTVLAAANGVIDENIWVAAYLNGRIDRDSSFGTNIRANWYQSGDALTGDSNSIGATAAYYRSITNHLTATAAVGVDGVSRDLVDDVWSAQALVGVRYSF